MVRALRESFPGVTFVHRVGSNASSWAASRKEMWREPCCRAEGRGHTLGGLL